MAAPSLYRGYVDGGGFILWKCAGRVRKTSRMIGRKRNSGSRALLAIGQSLCYDKAKNLKNTFISNSYKCLIIYEIY